MKIHIITNSKFKACPVQISQHHDLCSESELNFYTIQKPNLYPSNKTWKYKHLLVCPTVLLTILFVLVLKTNLYTPEISISSAGSAAEILQDDNHHCRINLVESIPEGLVYPEGSVSFPSTYNAWQDLIASAEETIDIGSFYWTLQSSEVYPDPSSQQGNDIFQQLLQAGKDGIKIRIAQNSPTEQDPNIDTAALAQQHAAEVRSVDFPRLVGGGVLHTKLWIIDGKHFYVGSANMDWRSLTQVKELGAAVYNCSRLTQDIMKIFEVYWAMGVPDSKIPPNWPTNLWTVFNLMSPMNISLSDNSFRTYISSSPPPMSPTGRTNDGDAIVSVISKAKKFVYISVMDYFPLTIYTPKVKFWPIIDNALRGAALNRKVKVHLLISYWKHSRQSEDYFLKSLSDLSHSYPEVEIEVRRFVVPQSEDQAKIPFGRVNHNKYMVTDNTAYIGTSNWSGDYFTDTAGIGLVMQEDGTPNNASVRGQLQSLFERDWNSKYASRQ